MCGSRRPSDKLGRWEPAGPGGNEEVSMAGACWRDADLLERNNKRLLSEVDSSRAGLGVEQAISRADRRLQDCSIGLRGR